jgi:hypothetical protein
MKERRKRINFPPQINFETAIFRRARKMRVGAGWNSRLN